ncbi:hypothetical protein C8R43DRAFT_940916 [Mycena crocata]|nr:hypothetical protein C8R43DRAFT_940916 [Mycena crocata]
MPNVKSPTTNGIEFFYKTRDGSASPPSTLQQRFQSSSFLLLSWEPGSREYRMIGGAEMNKLKERCFMTLSPDKLGAQKARKIGGGCRRIRDSPRYSSFPGNSRDSSHDSGLSRKPLAWYNGTHQNDRHDSGNFSPFEYDHRNRSPTVKFEPDSQNCAFTLSSGTGKNEHTPVKNFQSITQKAVTTTESTAVIVARLTHEYCTISTKCSVTGHNWAQIEHF